MQTRRRILTRLAAVPAAGLALPAVARQDPAPGQPNAPRGLAAPDDFLFEPGLTYLQTGSLGPTPRPVIDRTIAAWRELERNPSALAFGPLIAAMDDVRRAAATLLGCQLGELVLTNCTTEGMNWLAEGLHLEAGDRVLTTDQEHPGGRVCWDHVVRTRGVVLDVVAIPPGEQDPAVIVRQFEEAVTPRTRVFSFSHVTSGTGLRLPVAELSALARASRCLAVVDGAQAVGAIAVDVSRLGCHAYATSGHKWMMAPKGTGLLYLDDEIGSRIDPVALQSGRTAYTASSGVCSIPSVIGLGASVEYLTRIGLARIEAYDMAMHERLAEAIGRVPRLQILSPVTGPMASPMLTYLLPESVKSGELSRRLRERHRVEVKVVPGPALNGHRISTHLFNTERDIDALVRALKAELE